VYEYCFFQSLNFVEFKDLFNAISQKLRFLFLLVGKYKDCGEG